MNTTKSVFVRNVALAACLAIPAVASVAHAQDGQDATSLAPPVQTTPAPAPAGTVNDPAASVFNWKDVPTNQHIKITRAVFDQGGYQLYASTGETIVVPFENNNLYVMKFGQTIGGAMYFVNDGTTPTLFMSKTGYLENTAAQGAKWYPFSDDYDYTGPVYEGIAPSWDAYQDMGWYPGMVCYGGYWGLQPWGFGVGFECMPGFCFDIFGSPYFGWGGYYGYYRGHEYGRLGWGHGFGYGGVHGGAFGHGGEFGHGGAFGRTGAFGGAGGHGVGGFSGRTASVSGAFGGASGAHRAFSAQPGAGSGGSRPFGGVTSRAFGTGNMGGAVSRSPFSGGGRTFSGGGGSFGGGRAFSGGGSSFGGGGTRTFSGGGGSFGGGGGSHFGGGGGSFGGGGGGGHFGGGGGGGHR